MKTALILGCSHAAGSEMHLQPGIDLGGYIPQTFGLYNNFAALIAQQLGYHPINHAIPGGSNDAMFRIWESFVNPYTNRVRPDLVIACWTGNGRTEIWDYENQVWHGLAPGKTKFYQTINNGDIPEGEFVPESVSNETEILEYQRQWVIYHTDRWNGRLNKIKNMLALNVMAHTEGIPVINLDSFEPIEEFEYPDAFERPMGRQDFCTWAAGSGFQNTPQGHFFADAHKLYAKRVVEKLGTQYNA